MELCLGTVQFGMDYGVRGKKRPSFSDALEMIDYALGSGIHVIDTANAYGEAEDIVGTYFQCHKAARKKTQLISKVRPNLLDNVPPEQYYSIMKANLEESLRRLRTDYLDGYLLHSARYVFDDAIIDALVRLKNEGYARSIGVSVYEVEEAREAILGNKLDFLQLPYSILDQRMLYGGIFTLAEEKQFQIYSRSAFIQGLILMNENEVPPFLKEAAPILHQINAICHEAKLSRVQLAMCFVKRQKAVSHLVFGVRNLDQLKQDITLFMQDLPDCLIDDIAGQFTHLDANIVMPSLWKK